MTEEQWLTSTDPLRMLEFVRDKLTGRTLRLFACACCRRQYDLFREHGVAQAIELAEVWADGVMPIQELAEFQAQFPSIDPRDRGIGPLVLGAADALLWSDPFTACGDVLSAMITANEYHLRDYHGKTEARYARYLRCIAGCTRHRLKPPLLQQLRSTLILTRDYFFEDKPISHFCDTRFDPAWRTSTPTALARAIYEERAFDRLPILADAVEESGCDNLDILNHFRGDGPHVRGCWAIDLVLGKR